MRKGRWKLNLALGAALAVLVMVNVKVAQAHNWSSWHWHTGRDVGVWVYGSYTSDTNAALNDWDSHTDVNFNKVSSHTEISAYDGDYGATGWAGLASIESYQGDAHGWQVLHCHARYNKHYGRPWWDPGYWGMSNSNYRQGVQCQEIGHCLGLTHSNDGCMGMGYYNKSWKTVSHNHSDINAKF